MTDLETFICELAADEKSYGRDTTYIGASAVVKIGRELLTARKVVEAARAISLGVDDAGGPLAATMAALDAALSAHDAHGDDGPDCGRDTGMTTAPTPPTAPDPDTRPDWSIPNAETLADAHAGHDEIAAALAGREGVVMP